MKLITQLAALVIVSIGVAVLAQSPDWQKTILQKARQIYGEHAPTTITFLTVPKSELKTSDGFGTVSQVRANQPGDSATGVVLEEQGNQAVVDANPCNGKVMVFTQPYSKSSVQPVTCGGKTLQRFRFVQK